MTQNVKRGMLCKKNKHEQPEEMVKPFREIQESP